MLATLSVISIQVIAVSDLTPSLVYNCCWCTLLPRGGAGGIIPLVMQALRSTVTSVTRQTTVCDR